MVLLEIIQIENDGLELKNKSMMHGRNLMDKIKKLFYNSF
jgi:hypothetical protein